MFLSWYPKAPVFIGIGGPNVICMRTKWHTSQQVEIRGSLPYPHSSNKSHYIINREE